MKAPAALLASALVLLAGCSTAPIVELADATTTPTVSMTATPPPVPTPASGTLVIAGNELLVYPLDGTSPLAISYAESPEVFNATLTDLFGYEPEFTHHESEGDCDPSYDSHAWGEFALISNSGWIPDVYKVELHSSVASQNGITIVSSVGVGVGDNDSALADDSEYSMRAVVDGHTHSEVYFEVTPSTFIGADGDPYNGDMGGLLGAVDDIVFIVAAPVIVGAGGAC